MRGAISNVVYGAAAVVVVVSLVFQTVHTHDEGKLFNNVKGRLRLLEQRVNMEVSLLRQELYNELALLPNASSVNGSQNAENAENADVIRQLVDSFEKRVAKRLDSVKTGFATEKVFRRDLQKRIEEMKADQAAKESRRERFLSTLVDKVNTIAELLTDKLGKIDMDKLLQRAVTVPQGPLGLTVTSRASNCADLYRQGHVTSGVYTIHAASLWRPLSVFCDMETDGGGWTVFRRQNHFSDVFDRSWLDYRFGFGDLSGEFWLGNEYVHRLVSRAPHEMRIERDVFLGDKTYAKYPLFTIGDVESQFKVSLEGFEGNFTDEYFSISNGSEFATKDKGLNSDCAQKLRTGFWFKASPHQNWGFLHRIACGIHRMVFFGDFLEMKFRPK